MGKHRVTPWQRNYAAQLAERAKPRPPAERPVKQNMPMPLPQGCVVDNLQIEGRYILYKWTAPTNGQVWNPQLRILEPVGDLSLTVLLNGEPVKGPMRLVGHDFQASIPSAPVETGTEIEVIIEGTGVIDKAWLTFFHVAKADNV